MFQRYRCSASQPIDLIRILISSYFTRPETACWTLTRYPGRPRKCRGRFGSVHHFIRTRSRMLLMPPASYETKKRRKQKRRREKKFPPIDLCSLSLSLSLVRDRWTIRHDSMILFIFVIDGSRYLCGRWDVAFVPKKRREKRTSQWDCALAQFSFQLLN